MFEGIAIILSNILQNESYTVHLFSRALISFLNGFLFINFVVYDLYLSATEKMTLRHW